MRGGEGKRKNPREGKTGRRGGEIFPKGVPSLSEGWYKKNVKKGGGEVLWGDGGPSRKVHEP